MASYENWYQGTGYMTNPSYGNPIAPYVRTASIGLATDARTANQIKATIDKINTGAKTVEVQAISPDVMESIPDQHLKEINRMRKLAGVELTFHGPLVEPTGVGRDSWNEEQRKQAERQIWSAVERAHQIYPDGNLVVTLHTSNGLPEPKQRVKVKKDDGTYEFVDTSLAVIDERTGRFGLMPQPKKDYLLDQPATVHKELERLNTENWQRTLSNLNLEVHRGKEAIQSIMTQLSKRDAADGLNQEKLIDLYAKSKTPEGQKFIQGLSKDTQRIAKNIMDEMEYGKVFITEAYSTLQEQFNQAYGALERSKDYEGIRKLDAYKKEVAPKLKAWKNEPSKIIELGDVISKGVQVLSSIEPPEVFKPLEKFAIDKASDTFANVAVNSYKKFKNTAPILSLENPPVGLGLTRADEIRDLVKETRNKFVERAQKELHLSESEAKRQAEKLIGVTWDVGHINMLRKYGYTTKDIIKETEKIGKYVKHVHLSDNFGLEHTELPMGMGNVPMKEHMEIIKQYNDKVKKIIEAGNWYQHFQTTPYLETIQAFGTPMYTEGMPYWNQYPTTMGGYFSGFGTILPEHHFSVYGAGWSALPPELGGQMAGKDRVSGTPIE